MLNVTENAQAQIAHYFEDNEIKPIRIFLASACSGRQIALALDEARPEDKTFTFAGIQYLVERTFLKQAQPIEIDFVEDGFKISSSLKLEDGCGSCGTSGSCCS